MEVTMDKAIEITLNLLYSIRLPMTETDAISKIGVAIDNLKCMAKSAAVPQEVKKDELQDDSNGGIDSEVPASAE